MDTQACIPGEELKASSDPRLWAEHFTSFAWWDPLSAADSEVVALWFSMAMTAYAKAELARNRAQLGRLRRKVMRAQVTYGAILAVLLGFLAWRVLLLTGVLR